MQSIAKHFILISTIFAFNVGAIEVNTTSGRVKGTTVRVLNKTLNEFFNIPYAEPPVGALRFQRPVPLKQPKQV